MGFMVKVIALGKKSNSAALQGTDVKTYNVCVQKLLFWVKSLQNSTLFCDKVSDVAILRFFVECLAHFGTLCHLLAFFGTILTFWALYAVLTRIRFVVIYALFRVKYFLPQTMHV